MKKKTIIILIIFAVLIIASIIANYFFYDKQKDDYLECTYNNSKSSYQEKLTFHFIYGTLFKYSREEILMSDEAEEEYKKLKEMEESAPNYSYFTYKVTKKGNIIYVNTDIEAFYGQEFYNDYISELDLDYTDTIDEVKRELDDSYTCKKFRK